VFFRFSFFFGSMFEHGKRWGKARIQGSGEGEKCRQTKYISRRLASILSHGIGGGLHHQIRLQLVYKSFPSKKIFLLWRNTQVLPSVMFLLTYLNSCPFVCCPTGEYPLPLYLSLSLEGLVTFCLSPRSLASLALSLSLPACPIKLTGTVVRYTSVNCRAESYIIKYTSIGAIRSETGRTESWCRLRWSRSAPAIVFQRWSRSAPSFHRTCASARPLRAWRCP